MDWYALRRIGMGGEARWPRPAALAAIAFGFAAVLVLASGASASGDGGHFDVLLYDDGAGNLTAGGADVDELEADTDTVVFEGEMLGDSTVLDPNDLVFSGIEPGFFSFSNATQYGAGALVAPEENLPGGADVTVSFLQEPTLGLSFSEWNGSTWVSTTESISITKGLDGGVIDGSLNNEILDLAIGTTLSGGPDDGGLDDHPVYQIEDATGVFLLYGEASVAGFASPSNPFWFVMATLDECEETASCQDPILFPDGNGAFNEDIEEQVEAAIAYTNAVLVPEPGTLLLIMAGLLGLGARGRSARPRS